MAELSLSPQELMFTEAQERFKAAAADAAHVLGRQRPPEAVLGARTDLVRSTQALLDSAVYVELSGDFHVQDYHRTGKASPHGVSLNGVRVPSRSLSVGPYNGQTRGYYTLTGDIFGLRGQGLTPVIGYRGEPLPSLNYPLIASMPLARIRPIDHEAGQFPLTKELGIAQKIVGSTWGYKWDQVRDLGATDVRRLLGDTLFRVAEIGHTDPTIREIDGHMAISFSGVYTTLTGLYDTKDRLEAVESGDVGPWRSNNRVTFRGESIGRPVMAVRPDHTHLHRIGYRQVTTLVRDMRDGNSHGANIVFDMLGTAEQLCMAPRTPADGRVIGFGEYANSWPISARLAAQKEIVVA